MDISQLFVEQLIFKKILTDNEYLTSLIDFYDKRFFENKNLSITLDISLAYYKKYNKLPSSTVLNMLIQKYSEMNGIDYKSIIIDIKNSFDLQIKEDETFVRDTILKFIKNKNTYFTILDNIDKFEKEENVSNCVEKLQKIVNFNFSSDMGFDYYEQMEKHLHDISNPEAKLTTGFSQIDYVTYGGFPVDGRCLIIFMGQPFVGKSLILSNLAKNYMDNNKFPLIISLEMSEELYGKRIDAHIGELDINRLNLNTSKLRDKITDFHKLHPESKLLIKEFPPSSITCSNIATFVDKLSQVNKKPDVILVDYLNLLNPCNKTKVANSYERIGTICKELRALSYKYRIPIITVTQTNRQNFGSKEIGLEGMSESTGPAQDADFIASIWQETGDKEAGKLGMTILKNRFGGMAGKTLNFNINYSTLRLTDREIDDEGVKEDLTQNLIDDINKG